MEISFLKPDVIMQPSRALVFWISSQWFIIMPTSEHCKLELNGHSTNVQTNMRQMWREGELWQSKLSIKDHSHYQRILKTVQVAKMASNKLTLREYCFKMMCVVLPQASTIKIKQTAKQINTFFTMSWRNIFICIGRTIYLHLRSLGYLGRTDF